LNSLQIRNHNKEYLEAYKKNTLSLVNRHAVYSTGAYAASIADGTDVLNAGSYHNDFSGDQVSTNALSPRLRAAFVQKNGNSLSAESPAAGVRERAISLSHNAFNFNKRFARAHNFALPQAVRLQANSEVK